MANLTFASLNNKYGILINSYVQKTAQISAFEIYCPIKAGITLSVSVLFILFEN